MEEVDYPNIIPIIIILAVILIIILSFVINYFFNKKRTNEIRSFAQSKGYYFKEVFNPAHNLKSIELMQAKNIEYSTNPVSIKEEIPFGRITFFGHSILENWPTNMHCWLSAKVFNLGYSKNMFNYFEKIDSSEEQRIFDYNYVTRSGKSSHTHSQTVFVFKTKKVLPKFFLEKEGVIAKIIDFIGFKDIDFDNDIEFSKKWRLTGKNETEIREIFDQNLLNQFAQSNYFQNIESCSNFIIFYSPSKIVKIEELNKHIEEARKLSSLFY